jgi:hypothetical protein
VLLRGNEFRTQLNVLKQKYPQLVEDVRGWGLINGLELKKEIALNAADVTKVLMNNGFFIIIFIIIIIIIIIIITILLYLFFKRSFSGTCRTESDPVRAAIDHHQRRSRVVYSKTGQCFSVVE